jgi:hypothetical protein
MSHLQRDLGFGLDIFVGWSRAGKIALTDLPDGQITDFPVQPCSQKYFASPFGRNSFMDSAVPSRKRGVGHRHERWGGMRWTRQRRARNRNRRAGFGP